MTTLATQPGAPTKQGVYENVPDPVYRSIDAMSQSKLKSWVAGEEADGRQLIVGTAFHTRVFFGKEAFREQYVQAPQDYDFRRNEDKERFALDTELAGGKTLLQPTKEWKLIEDMLLALYQDPMGKRVLGYNGPTEVVAVADGLKPHGKFRGYPHPVKCMIDLVGERGMCDLKTTGYRDARQFQDAVVDYGYGVQDYAYTEIYATVTGEWMPFSFLCVSKQPPHCVWLTKLDPAMRAAGGKWWHDMLTLHERMSHEDE